MQSLLLTGCAQGKMSFTGQTSQVSGSATFHKVGYIQTEQDDRVCSQTEAQRGLSSRLGADNPNTGLQDWSVC